MAGELRVPARWVALLVLLAVVATVAALVLLLATAAIYSEVDAVFRTATAELTNEEYASVTRRYAVAETLRGIAPHVGVVGIVALFAAITAAGRLWDRRHAA